MTLKCALIIESLCIFFKNIKTYLVEISWAIILDPRWKVLTTTREPLLDVAQHDDGGHLLLLHHPPELGTGVDVVLIRTFRTSLGVFTRILHRGNITSN